MAPRGEGGAQRRVRGATRQHRDEGPLIRRCAAQASGEKALLPASPPPLLRPSRQLLLLLVAALAVVALVVGGHELLMDRAEDLLVRLRGEVDQVLAVLESVEGDD